MKIEFKKSDRMEIQGNLVAHWNYLGIKKKNQTKTGVSSPLQDILM
jgi:hypothetical protein